MCDLEVSSEIYAENNYSSTLQPHFDPKNVVSIFPFKCMDRDADGDLLVIRKKDDQNEYGNQLEIEHSKSSSLELVGTQIWRGALLLADWLICNGNDLPEGFILELGAGVGLTSIIASMFQPVISTDINLGNILALLDSNVQRNAKISKHPVRIMEIDFNQKEFSPEIEMVLENVRLIIAADVVYDNKLTDAFLNTVEKLIKHAPNNKCILIALEKRYVFTIEECDTWAPCYQYFIDNLRERFAHNANVRLEQVLIDFPQYFLYDRVKELVIWKITTTSTTNLSSST